MAKVGKLTKLKSAMKRLPSFTKNHHPTTTASSPAATEPPKIVPKDHDDHDSVNHDLHVVYVGKSRRRYMLSSDIVAHPLFQELVDRSSTSRFSGHDREIVVACEVVLFEHLLWMLNNCSGNDAFAGGSMEELAEFYTY